MKEGKGGNYMGALYIKDPKERIYFFFQCWKEIEGPYIPKEKYKFCHGNDLWIENLIKEESEINSFKEQDLIALDTMIQFMSKKITAIKHFSLN